MSQQTDTLCLTRRLATIALLGLAFLLGCDTGLPGKPPLTSACLTGTDCPSGWCNRGICQQRPSLSDGGPPTDTNDPPEQLLPPPGNCQPGQTWICYTGPAQTRNEGNCRDGQQLCQSDQTWGPCQQEILPKTEVCDGQDNDCDGQTDEGYPNLGQPCSKGVGACAATGIMVCSPDKQDVLCSATPAPPSPELCDGKDNDCDGQIDEDFPDKGKKCETGQGTCQSSGIFVCQSDGKGASCNAIPRLPQVELCNGRDDDCDGHIDNQPNTITDNNLVRSCYSKDPKTKGVGPCKAGSQRCVNGQWETTCPGEVPPQPKDSCNGTDDDCDGKIDGGCACAGAVNRNCSVNQGTCTEGTQTCINGNWGACSGATPIAELCDGLDNDCDGEIDEDYPNLGTACSVGIGECQRMGILQCNASTGAIECSVKEGQGTDEICDGKDNDCNGQIDDNINNKPCTTNQPGICAKGTRSCVNRIETCTPIQTPIAELCRNNLDDNCDGNIDEICGPEYAYTSVKPDGTPQHGTNGNVLRGFTSVTRTDKGKYTLKHPSYDCSKHPIMLTPQSKWMHSIAYNCSGTDYVVHTTDKVVTSTTTSNTNLPGGDVGFHAILPPQQDTWVVVDGGSCQNYVGGPCNPISKFGDVTRVEQRGVGYYRIYSTLCSVSWRPLFVSLRSNGASGYISGFKSNNGDYCEVTTYDVRGNLAHRTFALWLPSLTAAASASIEYSDSGTTIQLSNSPGSTASLWSSIHNNTTNDFTSCPNTGKCTRLTPTYKGWGSPSVPIAIYRRIIAGTASAEVIGNTVNITLFNIKDGSVVADRATILFAQ